MKSYWVTVRVHVEAKDRNDAEDAVVYAITDAARDFPDAYESMDDPPPQVLKIEEDHDAR